MQTVRDDDAAYCVSRRSVCESGARFSVAGMRYRDEFTRASSVERSSDVGEAAMKNIPIDDPVRLTVGAPVEVRVGYHGSWAAGFEIAGIRDDGYELRRQCDGATLPKRFTAAQLRPKR
jgi:hypothetical protein